MRLRLKVRNTSAKMNSKQNELKALLEQGLQFQKSKQEELAQLPEKVGAGDLFLLPVSVPVKWCAVFQNSKDKDLWYVVPCDEFSLLGTCDVALPEFADEAPLNFRCGHGLWIHFEDFNLGRRVGRIDQSIVDQIRDHLGRVVRGNLPTVETLVETDSDLDYLEWVSELSDEVQVFEQQLLEQSSGKSIQRDANEFRLSIDAFRDHQTEDLLGLVSQRDYSLVAESKSEYALDPSEPKAKSHELPFETDGKLFAMSYEGGVVLQAFGVGESPPEVLFGDAAVEWHRDSEWFTSPLLQFVKGRVVVQLGVNKVVIEQ